MMRRTAWLFIALTPASFGYIRFQVFNTTTPMARVDNTAIQFYLNEQIVPGLQSSASGNGVTVITADSNPQQAVRNAQSSWNAVSTANIHFVPIATTAKVIDSSDYQNTIAFGSTAADLSTVGGALAVTANFAVLAPANAGAPGSPPTVCNSNCTYPAAGDIYDSDIILNPQFSFSTTGATNTRDLQATLLHEFGHSLGANHSGILGASMYQFPTQRFLTADDLAFVNSIYPLPAGGAPLGTISGTVTAGGTPVPYGLLTATDTTQNITVGGITNPDGTYSFNVPPGNYQLYAEPLNGIVPINIYLSTTQATQASSLKFQTTFYSGTVAVQANGTQTANIAATVGAATLATPIYAVVPVGASVSNASPLPIAVTVPSGGSVDLVLSGPGFDNTLTASNFKFYNSAVSVKSVVVDKSQTFGSSPLLRVTLNVAAVTTQSLATFTVSNAANLISFSGALVVVPPTPTFVSAGVVSAAPYTGIPAEVSPGGIYSIYCQNFPTCTSNFGPTPYVTNAPNYDAYGFLATTIGGVTVTFDGIQAPMFLASGGQLNFQVPFELAGKKSTQVVVNYLGSASAPITVPVVPSQPLFFTSCNGTCAVNPDGTVNSAQNPIARGSFVLIFGTGIGQVSYTILTGQAAPALPANFTGNYSYSIGGSALAPAGFGGWTPGFSGLAQWNLKIPDSSPTGKVSIVVQDSTGATNQAQGATIFVQ